MKEKDKKKKRKEKSVLTAILPQRHYINLISNARNADSIFSWTVPKD